MLELSSYQIDLTESLDCDVAVLLNISPIISTATTSFEDYAASKARLFAMQSPDHVAVIGAEDDQPSAIAGQSAQAGGRSLISSTAGDGPVALARTAGAAQRPERRRGDGRAHGR